MGVRQRHGEFGQHIHSTLRLGPIREDREETEKIKHVNPQLPPKTIRIPLRQHPRRNHKIAVGLNRRLNLPKIIIKKCKGRFQLRKMEVSCNELSIKIAEELAEVVGIKKNEEEDREGIEC